MLRKTLSLLALVSLVGGADAGVRVIRNNSAACAGGQCSTVAVQSTVVIQPAPIVVQPPAPVVAAPSAGCQGSAPVAAGCAGGQGQAESGRRKLFSGGLFHRKAGRHNQASSGYEATTTTSVRQWDNQPPAAAIIVVPQAAPAPLPKADGQP